MATRYDALTDGIFFLQADPGANHAILSGLQRVADWTSAAGAAPVGYYPLGAHKGVGGNPSVCLRSWQRLFDEGESGVGSVQSASSGTSTSGAATTTSTPTDVSDVRRSGGYRNGLFYVSRVVVRQRRRRFWHSLFAAVNATEMCAPWVVPECRVQLQKAAAAEQAREEQEQEQEDEQQEQKEERPEGRIYTGGGNARARAQRSPLGVVPSAAHCKAAFAATRERERESGVCIKSCSALEHVWSQVLCQPCHNRGKEEDPRYPWTAEARTHPQPPATPASSTHNSRRPPPPPPPPPPQPQPAGEDETETEKCC
jgi:hypothetical protein